MRKTWQGYVLPDHLSYSQASSWQRCQEQVRLERLLKIPSRPNWASVGGSAVHSATEAWDIRTLSGDFTADDHTLEADFDAAFEDAITRELDRGHGFPTSEWRATGRATKEWPDKRDDKWWRVNGPLMLRRWVNWRMNNTWEIADVGGKAAIEVPFEVELGGIMVQGFIDRVFTNPQRTSLLCVDLKSGRKPDDITQLGTYTLALDEVYNCRPDWACYWMGEDGGTTAIESMASWTRARLDYLYGSIKEQQEQGVFLPHVTNMCGSCGVRASCYAVDGELSHLVPKPWEKGFDILPVSM
jgi:putative RecB family exonuclease